MNTHFRQAIIRHFKAIPRRRYLEVGLATAALLVISILVMFITPYSPSQPKMALYDSSSAKKDTIYRATVNEIAKDSIEITINDGPSRGEMAVIDYRKTATNLLRTGETILVVGSEKDDTLYFLDHFRIPILVILCSVFILTVLIIGRRKGLRSLVGLFASMLVILYILVPLVLSGFDTFFACIISAFIIAVLTTVASQGLTRRAAIMLICILLILLLVSVASLLVVDLIAINGYTDEAAYFISVENTDINLTGLVTGGIIIATLGALDDIVTTQVAVVDELLQTDTTLTKTDLFKRSSRVGAEHIASLVNTLALVYVGAALPVIVSQAVGGVSMLLLLNSEFAATEIVRTLIISIALVFAVPLSTFVATLAFSHQVNSQNKKTRLA